ncbi:hypothetical protein O5O45_09120 [Hahella aquimaris]|uniref:hypothetical protein n=1 Tax=Hahella sp. HNIBRBA332 TaxID=3015983 RepID=UPI00273AAB01|nr:hypothetical protein [Hahella sp. HNIBRBA332]WLQ16074.1 hypothetical protein O5O45_09120 [Hahella sp. HNIBRBA332]
MKILSRSLILFTWLIGSVCSLSASANVSGDVRGVTFFYLDGVHQDFPWVLDNQRDPEVRKKIDSLLNEYRNAGVNWIRILVDADHYGKANENPVPSLSLIQKVNDFMRITRTGDQADWFTIELVLDPYTIKKEDGNKDNGKMQDIHPYDRDKLWYKTWLDNLDYTNLGMVVIGGDLSPCSIQGCDQTGEISESHASWIKEMWSWKEQYYPELNATYEVIGNEEGINDPRLISILATWIEKNTPTVPVIAASIYIDLPSGSHWVDYAEATNNTLEAYHSVTSKPLWIDEFGKNIRMGSTVADQKAAYEGFLGASICWRKNKYAKFAWVGGNDYPYKDKYWYGLVSGFNSNDEPVMRPAWSVLSQYYNLQQCP